MELGGKQHSRTSAGVRIPAEQGSVDVARDPGDDVQESRIVQTDTEHGGGARTGAPVYPGGGTAHGTSGRRASDRVDACLCRRHGKKREKLTISILIKLLLLFF